MEIIVKKLDKKKYSATLYIDGEMFTSSVEPRAGCAIRTVLNYLQLKFGEPEGELSITINGW
jgi:hypothetical protein